MKILLRKNKVRLSYVIPSFNDRSALFNFLRMKRKKLLDSFERFNRVVYLSADDIKKIIRLNDKQDNSKVCRRVNAVNLLKEYLKKGIIK
ncbi:hypothetical protein [Campylobacter jejuni]|uniref:hypothetical protein n=1 Tax=Campylobacter jejuni TaxID=197 RepID=UPI00073DD82A|nr:hypothetical protein [Campylobacter jejuni]ALW15621.1 hypothetical protein RC26_02710 [Campylobacter jejuni]MBX1020867.1 hypothetical protein [Campylobacter jejuni]HED5364344.1 hypothetical protein [Campylobacter jejuni]